MLGQPRKNRPNLPLAKILLANPMFGCCVIHVLRKSGEKLRTEIELWPMNKLHTVRRLQSASYVLQFCLEIAHLIDLTTLHKIRQQYLTNTR